LAPGALTGSAERVGTGERSKLRMVVCAAVMTSGAPTRPGEANSETVSEAMGRTLGSSR
jgi:hypothetical protein